MASGGYDIVQDGEWHSLERKNNFDECCDCCLTHRVEYKFAKGKIWFRCWREDELTRRKRRRRGIQIVNSRDRPGLSGQGTG